MPNDYCLYNDLSTLDSDRGAPQVPRTIRMAATIAREVRNVGGEVLTSTRAANGMTAQPTSTSETASDTAECTEVEEMHAWSWFVLN